MNSQNLSLAARITEQPVPTLAEWLSEWVEIYKSPCVKENTASVYRFVIQVIGQTPFARCPIDELTDGDLQRLLNLLKRKGYSRSTIQKAKYTLEQALTKAFRSQMLKNRVWDDVALPQAPTKKVRALTREEQARVEAACSVTVYGDLILCLLRTGLRRAELIGLQWTDYDPKKRCIYIRKSKTEAGERTVMLLSEAQEIIEKQPRINEYIFNTRNGTPVTDTVMKKLYLRIRKAAAVPILTNHVCRHTFVTRLCEEKVSPKTIAKIIGHANSKYVLDIYASVERDEEIRAIYALERAELRRDTVTVSLRLDKEVAASLEKEANKLGVSLEQYICCQIK